MYVRPWRLWGGLPRPRPPSRAASVAADCSREPGWSPAAALERRPTVKDSTMHGHHFYVAHPFRGPSFVFSLIRAISASMRLSGKVAIVTGGSRGIGRAICLRLAREGARVVVNYARVADAGPFRGSAQRVVEEIRAAGGQALAVEADVSNGRAVAAMVQRTLRRFGRIDILVNNAGICPFAEFLTMPEKLWNRVQDVNLKGVFVCTQAVAREMVKRRIPGRIISISSISSIVGGEKQAHYCPTKAGINLFTKSIAIALGKYGITCNAVLPGTVETDINKEDLKDEAKRRYFISRTPLGRLGRPEDIAGPVVFFASDDAAYITGATLVVDGGVLVNLQ